MRTVTIVGVGRVGGALALSLTNAGFEVVRLVTNDVEAARILSTRIPSNPSVSTLAGLLKIDSDCLFVTTQDSKIRNTALELAKIPIQGGEFAFHTSGALSSTELLPLEEAGWRAASVHPLISISDPERGAASFEGAYFAVEGEVSAVKMATTLVRQLGGLPFEVETDQKALYHAAAVVACGHLVALVEISQRMLAHCGLENEMIRRALIPLIESTVANLGEHGPAKALTGPFQRADA
ncbi:MAG: DUF2520 domain-containing protein, partial [Acidobacteriota bacterium]|nr:DUF2520 domain-containing protein [Acidobacteriota bacterium]